MNVLFDIGLANSYAAPSVTLQEKLYAVEKFFIYNRDMVVVEYYKAASVGMSLIGYIRKWFDPM